MVVGKYKLSGPVCIVDPDEKKKLRNKIRRIALSKLFDQVKYVENQERLKYEESKINNHENF